MDYKKIVNEIIELVGTESNIKSHTSCMTRLRISIKDINNVDMEGLKSVEGVLGINTNGDELQLIFGPGKVTKARNAMDEIANYDTSKSFEQTINEQKDQVKSQRTSKFQSFMGNFSNIFVPLIPGFIAAGILAGLAGLFSSLHLGMDLDTATNTFIADPDSIWTGITAYLGVFNKSLLTFMFIMVGYNATAAFGGSGVIGGIIGGMFILGYGSGDAVTGGLISSGMTTFFGIVVDPRGGMIGVLITAIVGAKVELFIRRKFSWEATDIITTPILTLIIMSAFAFIVVMPIAGIMYDGMNWAFINLSDNPLGATVLAGLFLPAVMMGIHQGFVPVYEGLVNTIGFNSLFPILAMAGAGQVGASLALYTKADKNSNLRNNIRGAIIPGFLGVGEPLIYGVTLPRVRPFFTAMAGGAVGGFYIGLLAMFGLPFGLNTVFGASGILGTLAMTNPNDDILLAMGLYLSALVVAYVAGYFITLLFGVKNVDLS